MQIASGTLDGISFEKYKQLEFKSASEYGLLFMPDMRDAVKGYCPFCGRRLYEMRNRPLVYCKNKGHKKFFMDRSKMIV